MANSRVHTRVSTTSKLRARPEPKKAAASKKAAAPKKMSASERARAKVLAARKRRAEKTKSLTGVELKYALYENSVQCPDWHVKHFPEFHEWLLGKKAYKLREDFCGTARISCEWVKKSKQHTAVGLDLDPEPLKYGTEKNLSQLSPNARERVRLLQENVLHVTKEKFDLVAACNFSFFIFLDRKTLLEYFRAVYLSLDKQGTFFLEMAGGEGMREKDKEQRSFLIPKYGRCQYVWEQHGGDPVSAIADYSIHYQLPNNRWIKDQFTYHWRLYGVRELRDILEEAGFEKTAVFWEQNDKRGNGTGDYVPTEKGDQSHSWITYVTGVKGAKVSKAAAKK